MEIIKLLGKVFSSGVSEKGNSSDGEREEEGTAVAETPAAAGEGQVLSKPAAPVMRCKVDEESRNATGRELRRSKTASRILPAEFTVEETRTFTSEGDESRASEKFEGTNWESAAYEVERFFIEDEVTALDVSEQHIVVQYHVEPHIDVFDRKSKKRLFRLEGHDYGGQCLCIRGSILYSGSMDKTVRSWFLGPEEGEESESTRRPLETIYNHLDYVQSLAADSGQNWVASGGRGDKDIYAYETDAKGKLWRRHKFSGHEGWVTQLLFVSEGSGSSKAAVLASGSEDAGVRLWCLVRGTLLRVLPQDEAVTCLTQAGPDLLLFGDRVGKLSFLDLGSRETTHLLPNILVGTGRYCRSSKYHDKAVDVLHATGNGFIVTASQGSKFVKIWRVERKDRDPDEYENTEVTELQILREHSEFLTTFAVFEDTIYSSCADGQILCHVFPKNVPRYEMAKEQEDTACSVLWKEGGGLASQPQDPTELCLGPRLCRTGKTGLVKSSSSFQVSIQLKPSAVRVDTKIRLPTTVREEDEEDEDDDDESTSWSAVGSDVEDGVEDETDGSSSYFETETDTDDNDET